jgi:exopolysaccharide biosynthesis polyprenyl glycosylphosphotransferase
MSGHTQAVPTVRLDARTYLVLQALFDLVALTLAWQIARDVCVVLAPIGVRTSESVKYLGIPLGMTILVIWLGIGLWLKHYTSFGRSHLRISYSRLVEMVIVVVGLLVLGIPSVYRNLSLELLRSFAVVFAPLSLISLAAARYAASLTAARTKLNWLTRARIAIIARGADAMRMTELIRQGGYPDDVAGVILPEGVAGADIEGSLKVLATTGQLAETINREHLGRVIIVHGALPDQEVEHCCRVARRMSVTISRTISPSVFGAKLGFTTLSGVHLLDQQPVHFTRNQEVVKRLFDVVASLILIGLISPILILTAILVKLTSKGPVLYTSFRVGRGGRYFTFHKFRSMTHSSSGNHQILRDRNEQRGHLFKIKRDPRVTPFGRFIRRYSIDELPQLFNVLIGDMSLVGPRPLPTEDMEGDGMSREHAEWAETRARALPGITGLWQVHGRSNTGFDRMTTLDIEYIKKWSLKLDLMILLKTPAAVLRAAGAY